MTRRIDLKKTLDELDPPAWGETERTSRIATTCHRLRRKRLGDFEVEDLRIMIGQQIGLPWLVPLALGVLEKNPLAEGDLFPGDLLSSVLQVPGVFWSRDWRFRERLTNVLDNLGEPPVDVVEAVRAFRTHFA